MLKNGFGAFTDSLVNVMNLYFHDSRALLIDLTLKSRKGRHDHNYSELFFVLMGSTYPFNYRLWNCVLDWYEELILNINKLFGIKDKFDICL